MGVMMSEKENYIFKSNEDAVIVCLHQNPSEENDDLYFVFCTHPEDGIKALNDEFDLALNPRTISIRANLTLDLKTGYHYDWRGLDIENPTELRNFNGDRAVFVWHGYNGLSAIAILAWVRKFITEDELDAIMSYCSAVFS
jgi:hypothetical protein